MKYKIFFLFVLFFTLSCSKDDNEIVDNPIDNPSFNVNLLLNRWKFNQININGQQFQYQNQPNCQIDEFTFTNQEGQIRQYQEIIFINDICSTNSVSLDWRIKNDIISLYFGTQKIIDYKVIFLSANSLIYSFSVDINNDSILDEIIIFASPYI
jgi:hypothetical protein